MLLLEDEVLLRKRLLGFLENAGAEVFDEQVVVDGNLITSRKPGDIPAFNAALIAALQQAA